MEGNPETCSNCGAENRPGADFCAECGQPLTQSAESGLREQQDAQDHGGLIGGNDEVPPGGTGVGGLGSPRDLGLGAKDVDATDQPNVDQGAHQRRTGV
jgi:hypothetical protein